MHAICTLLIALMPLTQLYSYTHEKHTAITPPKGQSYSAISYNRYRADTFWNNHGHRCNAYQRFEKHSIGLYGEYGATTQSSAAVSGEWVRIDETLDGKTFGIEDIALSLKHCFKSDQMEEALAWHGTLFIPTKKKRRFGLSYGRYGAEIGVRSSGSLKKIPCCRSGSYDLEIALRGYDGFAAPRLIAFAGINSGLSSYLLLTTSLALDYGLYGHWKCDYASHFLANRTYRLLVGEVEFTFAPWGRVALFAGYRHHIWGNNVGLGGWIYGGGSLRF